MPREHILRVNAAEATDYQSVSRSSRTSENVWSAPVATPSFTPSAYRDGAVGTQSKTSLASWRARTLAALPRLSRDTLTDADVVRYNRDGFIVVPGVLSETEVAGLREATDELITKARQSAHNEVYDLEPGHTAESPKVRRIKTPDRWDSRFAAMVRQPGIVACLQALWGPNIRYDTSKLNMKAAGFGSPVEWHQDWAFYPHTNDDLAAVGIMIDDVDEKNGPLLVLPGTHRGPVYDHHADGRFCGAIDPTNVDVDFSAAVPCMGKAGSITIHHARAVHASAPNTSLVPPLLSHAVPERRRVAACQRRLTGRRGTPSWCRARIRSSHAAPRCRCGCLCRPLPIRVQSTRTSAGWRTASSAANTSLAPRSEARYRR